ncbi:MAG: hypothetical protein DHS20C15_18040 [Planctomycetota bacterium]|nr:MAG: hypothetical protein DHS20C15_18040 [Planctomycetota bacterium]
MLSLLLAAAFALPQDTPTEPAPPVAAPETPAAVTRFLASAQAKLYDPRQNGLESLSFSAPLKFPMGPEMLELGAVDVAWMADEPVNIEPRLGELPDALKAALPAEMIPQFRATIEAALPSLAEQLLSIAIGDLFGPLMQTHSGALGTTDGAVSITFTSAQDPTGVGATVVWTFDDDGLPLMSVTEAQQEGPMGPMTVTVNTEHSWRAGPGGKLVLDKVTATRSIAGQSIVETTTAEYVTHADMLLLTAIESKQSMMGQELVNRIDLKNLMANGEAVRAVSAPADAESDG